MEEKERSALDLIVDQMIAMGIDPAIEWEFNRGDDE